MKSLIKASEIHAGLLKINRQRTLYYKKTSEKIQELSCKKLFHWTLVDGRKNESAKIHPITKPDLDIVSGAIKKNKLYRFRLKVKTIIAYAYELE